ncbi:DegV family protein [Arthrobacter sp. H14]|uniref:DegV family protein n=1 Tax=Arthrobacter sp. H14 TaxID=1312959 RepID=UPI0004BB346C|nr:DegV family protein [Arthrobacter sp. H14]
MKWLDLIASRRPEQVQDKPDDDGANLPPVPEQRIAVVTDSAAALPVPWLNAALARGAFHVVPMPVMIAEEIFGEGVDDLDEALCMALAEGKPVRTSRPSPGQFKRVYELLAEAGCSGIVSVHISAGLSGTTDAARLGAASVPIPVEVVDTRTVGMAQGFAVQAALAAAGHGESLTRTAAAAVEAAAESVVYFYVPSLEQLRRGGRIGAAASWLGTILAVKPILAVRDGMVVPLEKVRSVPRAVARLEELALDEFEQRDPRHRQWAVHHFGNRQLAQELSMRLRLRSGEGPIPQLTALPAVLAAHAGLGALVVVVSGGRLEPTPDHSSST